AVGTAGERHVERGGGDVQVLGVDHDDGEHQHHADVQQQPDLFEYLVGALTERVQHGGGGLRGERAALVGEVAGVDGRAAEQEHRPQHVEDHEEDEPGTAEV